MSEFQHTIQAVARRTGLSPHVIRVWEKRYAAVTPGRTKSNRRLYSDEQVARLSLLRRITQAGQGIGTVARLPLDRLRSLAEVGGLVGGGVADPASADRAGPLLDRCLAAVRALDAEPLERALTEAEVELGSQGMLQRVAAPLARAIGDLWREGAITAAHEHFASAVLRTWLAQSARSHRADASAPGLIVATPAGQFHELGALLVGALAANLGWQVTYLGASLPAPEIAGAARQNRVRAVALSIVYPCDDPRLEGELERLRRLLPDGVGLLAGGQAVSAYGEVLDRIGALQPAGLAGLGEALDALRGRARV